MVIFYGPEEAPKAKELDQKSPESSMRVEGAPYPPGRALLLRGCLAEFQTSTPSLMDCFRSKKDHHEGFITFGFHLVFLFCGTLKQVKNKNWH